MHTNVCKLYANKVTHTLASILYTNCMHTVHIQYVFTAFELYVICIQLHANRMYAIWITVLLLIKMK